MDFESGRRKMVDTQLRPAAVTDPALLRAMGQIPRERFLPKDRRPIAYADIDHPLSASGRAMAAAAPMARLIQLAKVDADDVVLDIGCGTGYSTAVLASLASAVVGLENDAELVEAANTVLVDLDIGNAAVLEGDLAAGVPDEAPFDVIVLEGAVDIVPQALFDQLRDGGRLVAMFVKGATATARVFVRSGDDIATRSAFDAALPRLLPMQQHHAFSL